MLFALPGGELQAEGAVQEVVVHLLSYLPSRSLSECRDVLLPLLIDQLSGQLDDNSSKPDHDASSQLLSNILEVLDRKDVVSQIIPDADHSTHWSHCPV